ncbi:cryptochrome/photolyase family protein [Flavobacterium beibuense]|nr:cryptochrome/photolyase family protein [Flavobacterium beibuense]
MMKKNYHTLRLILGDQLNINHSWFKTTDDTVLYVLMEVRSETDYVWHHIQKVTAFFAAMENFYLELKKQNHNIVYIRLDDTDNQNTFSGNCSALIKKYNIRNFEYQYPDEYRVDKELSDFCTKLDISYKSFDTEHFYTTREELANFFQDKKTLLMESFYREMRKKHNVLISAGEPEGGQWNFDSENRKKIPKSHNAIPPYVFHNDVTDQHSRITKAKIKTIGRINPEQLVWPVNREQSLELLKHFTDNCLMFFGTFQDAMQSSQWSLYHSRLSFSLNSKMISPQEVTQAVIKAWRDNPDTISLNQTEGFIRQIIGWREYMRGVYWLKMPEFEKVNFFSHKNPLPGWYWTGETKMNCLKQSIKQSLDYAYAHHIQRLMITGNFALLAGVHPNDVDAWYLGIYIDAIQWVEITNTRGMSQYADGGAIATKPYTASANYIHKMSNYCDGCSYNYKEKTSENACPFNSLYWNFHDRNRAQLGNNPRLAMVYRLWDKMAPKEKAAILEKADCYLNQIESL